MRTITRVGLVVGAAGLVALYGLQIVAGLFVAPAVALIGVITGIGVAKWLERGWYGRQFVAGLRAGLIACGATGVGAALFLLLQGPHSLATLSARSQLGPLSLSHVITQYAYLGWAGIDVGASLVAMIAGIFLAAITTQIFAWSKSRHSLRVVEQARLVAESFNRSAAWAAPPSGGRMTSGPMVGPGLSALWPQPTAPSGSLGATPQTIPPLPSALGAGAAWGATGAPSTPLAHAQPKAPSPTPAPKAATAVPGANFGGGLTAMPQTTPPPLTTQSPKGAKGGKGAQASRWNTNAPGAALATAQGATPPPVGLRDTPTPRAPAGRNALNQGTLSEAQREALGEWANDPASSATAARGAKGAGQQGKAAAPANVENAPAPTDEDGEPTVPQSSVPQSRTPNPSAYLNSETPAPRRPRKKQNTRDWLC